MQTTLYQDWTILSGDTTLRRALKKNEKQKLLIISMNNLTQQCCVASNLEQQLM